MTIELLFVFIALWLLAGIIDAWILYRRRHVGWGWLVVCVLTGPLSVAAVFDQVYLVEPETAPAAAPSNADDSAPSDDADSVCPLPDMPVDWPDDDPEGRLMPYGIRRIADD